MEESNDLEDSNSYAIEQKSNTKIWLFILIPLFIIVVGVVIFLIIFSSSKTVSDDDFVNGIILKLKENKEIKFVLDDEEHSLKTVSIGTDSIDLIIQSNPIQFNIKIGEEKKFDLNNDKTYDIYIKLNGINEGVPEIYLKKIHENICTENWNCTAWNTCTNGQQIRTCTDLNSCGTNDNKPSTTQNCTLCTENWNCTSWSICTNEQQTRNCTDLNSCGTITNKPTEQQICSEILDCASDFDCFIDASENCDKAKLLNTNTLDLFGILSTTKTYMELKGVESGKCVYYQRTESNSVEFSDELVQQMLDEGATQEEIEQAEQEANESVQETVGLKLTCKFENDDLTAMLTRWKQGTFDSGASCTLINQEFVCEYSGDFEDAECISSS